MNSDQVKGHVTQLFSGRPHRTVGVGIEHELFTADTATGAFVSIERVRAAAEGSAYSAHLEFEPGGQVELSLPPAPNALAAADDLATAVAALRADCDEAGIRLIEDSVDRRPADSIPLQLANPRYLAMQERFDSFGPAGRRMMRRTASTQFCLDWWSGAAGIEQWQLLNLAGPFLAAAFARSFGPESRLATWLEVDPERTAFDGRLVSGDDPVAAYTDFALGAAVLSDPGDIPQHLTMLFPPVRPRRTYLETRFLDAQPLTDILEVASVLSTLLYDDAVRSDALRVVDGVAHRLDEFWRAASLGDIEVTERGHALVELAAGPKPLEMLA